MIIAMSNEALGFPVLESNSRFRRGRQICAIKYSAKEMNRRPANLGALESGQWATGTQGFRGQNKCPISATECNAYAMLMQCLCNAYATWC